MVKLSTLRRAPLRRGPSRLQRYTRLRPLALTPKRGRVEDPARRAWIRTQPCLAQGRGCRWVEAHHIDRPRDDRRVVPLCAWLHREHPTLAVHTISGGRRAFEQHFGLDFQAEVRRLNQLWALARSPLNAPPCDCGVGHLEFSFVRGWFCTLCGAAREVC